MFPDECTPRRDADLAHIAAFGSVLIASVNKYFDAPYGNSQVQLYHLATHPDYQRHGAGTRLLNWGPELATREKKPITLFGSPMGTKLYADFGFRVLDYVTAQVDGEEENVSLCVMVYDKNLL
jgi:GNAT superfamily N-acetyltransferase